MMRSDPLVPTCSRITVRPSMTRESVLPMKFEPLRHSNVQAESPRNWAGSAVASLDAAGAGAAETGEGATSAAGAGGCGVTIATEIGDACIAGCADARTNVQTIAAEGIARPRRVATRVLLFN